VTRLGYRRPVSFVAEAVRTSDRSPEEVFDRLADARGWSEWMSGAFRPLWTPDAPLRPGDRPRVRIGLLPPTTLEITVADRPRELTWTGGVRGVLFAEHRFLFEPLPEGGTRVRSLETWSGALATLVRPIVKPVAERMGGAQLERLTRAQ